MNPSTSGVARLIDARAPALTRADSPARALLQDGLNLLIGQHSAEVLAGVGGWDQGATLHSDWMKMRLPNLRQSQMEMT